MTTGNQAEKRRGKMQEQFQKRWLLQRFDQSVLDSAPYSEIEDGYWETSPGCINRIRIQTDHIGAGASRTSATLTVKSGSGTVRKFEENSIDTRTAAILRQTCPNSLLKTRYHFGNWKLDIFHGPLAGLTTLEAGLNGPDDKPDLPEWVDEVQEITDHLSNYHLARLGRDLVGIKNVKPFQELLARIPRIVVTGGPCSGKSSVMNVLNTSPLLKDRFHCVPEVATIVISQVGVRPPVSDQVAYKRFQRTIYAVQTGFEEVSEAQALADSKEAVITDRGVIDNAAYLENGLTEFATICKTNVQYELGRYDLVIHLDVPNKDIYEINMRNNPARNESWADAMELDLKIGQVWKPHSQYTPIHHCRSMGEKIKRVTDRIEKFLRWYNHQA